MRPLAFAVLVLAGLEAAPAALAQAPVRVYNLMTGTNMMVQTAQRMGKVEVTGDDFCRVKYEQNGTTLELFPLRIGKTRIWIYDAVENKILEEVRVNVSTAEVIALYDQYAAAYKSVEGLVVDIEANKVAFSGTIFSMSAYRRITELSSQMGFSVNGLMLHPYVNAVLAEPLSSLPPMPGQITDTAVAPSTTTAAPAPAPAAPAATTAAPAVPPVTTAPAPAPSTAAPAAGTSAPPAGP